MISVLFLIPTLDRGGAENVLIDLVNHMDQNKFRITVQTLFDWNSQKSRLYEGIEYRSFLCHQFRGNSRLMARIPAKLLYRMIVKEQYDIVISYLEGPTTHILSGCPFPKTKKVAWIHSALNSTKGFSSGFATKQMALKAYESFDKIVFVAESVKAQIEKTTGTSFLNACVLYNTINSEEIKRRSEDKLGVFSFPKDEFVIISTGKITPVKGYDRLAHIQKKLFEEGYKTHIYILGQGKDRKTIETYLKTNGIMRSFTFLGYQDNPYKYMVNADLFVCSSRREGFSTSVSEALILGVPVISTNCSGAYELLGYNNEFGVVTDNNEYALFEGIKHLINNHSLLLFYKKQAIERGSCFSIDKTVSAVENMLLSI